MTNLDPALFAILPWYFSRQNNSHHFSLFVYRLPSNPLKMSNMQQRISKLVPWPTQKTKKYYTSQYFKLQHWNSTRIYPNPITYRGAFEAKRNEHTVRPRAHFEEIMGKIRAEQNTPVSNPSPVHIVSRNASICLNIRPWYEHIILRKLGLLTRYKDERVLIPNTPHWNRLLFHVKHLVRIVPMTFPDGIPSQEDIGRTKFNIFSGECRIGDQFKQPVSKVEGDKKPQILETRQMRNYLRHMIGIFST